MPSWNKTRLSRREFLTGAAATVGAVAASGLVGLDGMPLPQSGALAARAPRKWGVWHHNAPFDMGSLDHVLGLVGQKPEVVHWYQPWREGNFALNRNNFRRVAAYGAEPIVSWMPPDSLRDVASGAWDSYIKSWARGLKGYGGKVYLRIGHEMNLPNHPWSVGVNGNTGADFIAMWRRTRRLFREKGATNVLFVWAPNIRWEGTLPYSECYPGGRHVDWIGLDGYNGGTALDWGGWQSFEKIFYPSYKELTPKRRPMMVTEVGSVEQGGDKARWISDAFVALKTKMPAFRTILWFNEHGSGDWRIDTSSASASAFKAAVANW